MDTKPQPVTAEPRPVLSRPKPNGIYADIQAELDRREAARAQADALLVTEAALHSEPADAPVRHAPAPVAPSGDPPGLPGADQWPEPRPLADAPFSAPEPLRHIVTHVEEEPDGRLAIRVMFRRGCGVYLAVLSGGFDGDGHPADWGQAGCVVLGDAAAIRNALGNGNGGADIDAVADTHSAADTDRGHHSNVYTDYANARDRDGESDPDAGSDPHARAGTSVTDAPAGGRTTVGARGDPNADTHAIADAPARPVLWTGARADA